MILFNWSLGHRPIDVNSCSWSSVKLVTMTIDQLPQVQEKLNALNLWLYLHQPTFFVKLIFYKLFAPLFGKRTAGYFLIIKPDSTLASFACVQGLCAFCAATLNNIEAVSNELLQICPSVLTLFLTRSVS